MRLALLLPALLFGTGALTAADRPLDDKDQAALTRRLAGLTPQRPVECLPIGNQTYTSDAYGPVLAYGVNRSRVYVNETTGGCEGAAHSDVLVSIQYQDRACSGDIIHTVDPASHFPTGSCTLRQFTPYLKLSK